MTNCIAIALLIAWLPLGCELPKTGDATDGSPPIPDADLGSSCSPSTAYLKCDGNNVLRCACTKQGAAFATDALGQPLFACAAFTWVRDSSCTVACDTGINPSSACIDSTHPIPECAHDGLTCWNGNLTACLKGYPLPSNPCAAGTQCMPVPGCGPVCIQFPPTIDPRCPASPWVGEGFCAGNTAYHCACGYLTGTQACAPAPNDCVTVPSYDPDGAVSGAYAECGLP